MHKLLGVLVLAFSLVLGFFQENAKVGINYYLEQSATILGFYQLDSEGRREAMKQREIDAPFDYYYSHRKLDFLNEWSESKISKAKWGLAAVLIVVNFGLNFLLLRFWTEPQLKKFRALLLLTISAVLICGVFLIGGKLLGYAAPGYNVARKALGFLQGPLPAIVLWLGWKLSKTTETKTEI